MESIDRSIRGLYVLAAEEEWQQFRALALEQVCRVLGADAAAWLTQADDQPSDSELTAWPAGFGVTAAQMQTLALGKGPVALEGAALQGHRRGLGFRYGHYDSRLVSRIALWFKGEPALAPPDVGRLLKHLAEAGALALTHFILRDERLSKWGRSNRGTAALIDARGTVYAASRGFRELLGSEFGNTSFDRLPFALPEDAAGGEAAFSRGNLRFRTTRADNARLLLYARKAQPMDGLSPREQQIARALSAGKTFKSVARQCGIATSTVANHASRIYRKLGVYRREELLELIRATDGSRKQESAAA